MKIKRIIAAVMVLVLVGGAYPSKAVNNANGVKAYAADSASEKKEDSVGVTSESEKAPSFSAESDTYKNAKTILSHSGTLILPLSHSAVKIMPRSKGHPLKTAALFSHSHPEPSVRLR